MARKSVGGEVFAMTKTLNKYLYVLYVGDIMTNMTLAVPEDLKRIMEKHKEVKWSEVARTAMWEHAKKLELMEKLVARSRLTEKDALEIGKKIKKEIAKRHGL